MSEGKFLKEIENALTKKVKVKYKVIDTPYSSEINETTLKEFNKYGWELVTVLNCYQDEKPCYKMIFKQTEEIYTTEEPTTI